MFCFKLAHCVRPCFGLAYRLTTKSRLYDISISIKKIKLLFVSRTGTILQTWVLQFVFARSLLILSIATTQLLVLFMIKCPEICASKRARKKIVSVFTLNSVRSNRIFAYCVTAFCVWHGLKPPKYCLPRGRGSPLYRIPANIPISGRYRLYVGI